VSAAAARFRHSGLERDQDLDTWKEAVLENGFVAPGELVRIDTRTERYLERVRLERKKGA
jgi:hypothetical protein